MTDSQARHGISGTRERRTDTQPPRGGRGSPASPEPGDHQQSSVRPPESGCCFPPTKLAQTMQPACALRQLAPLFPASGAPHQSTVVVGLPEPEFQTQVETAVTHPRADRTHELQGPRQRTSFPGMRSRRRALEIRCGCSVVLRAQDPSTPAPRWLLRDP